MTASPTQDSPREDSGTEDQPTIVAAHVVAGHDGQAEVAVQVLHPNGARRDICFPHDAIGPVLDAADITALDQLVGRPWTVLLGGNDHTGDTTWS